MLVVEVRPTSERADPDLIVRQPLHHIFVVADVAVEVHAGRIAGVLDHLAEHHRAGRQLGAVDILRAGVFKRLPVEGHGHGYLVVGNEAQDKVGLLGRLYRAGGLGKEVHAHVQSGVQRALYVVLELLVNDYIARLAAAIAAAYHGELHAVRSHGLPVDYTLVERHVHAEAGLIAVADVLGQSVRVGLEVLLGEVGDGHALRRVDPLVVGAGVDIGHALVRVGLRLVVPAGREGQRHRRGERERAQAFKKLFVHAEVLSAEFDIL